ncbi:MAG: hypothetical protein KDC12_03510 [Flavobacteriales bacterium]|nr:hypothetical protein [Flavobacteriales bacterium]
MIKYDPKNWFNLIFHAYSKQVFRKLLPGMLGIAALTTLLTWVELRYFDLDMSTTAVHSMLGFVLGLFLVFRTNTAYDRWWEGRKAWGALVNNSRSLALKVEAFAKSEEDKVFFRFAIPAFAYYLKQHLRGAVADLLESQWPAGCNVLKEWEHKPNALSHLMYTRVKAMRDRNEISAEEFFVLDKELKALTDVLGICERIRNTPIPYSYSMYMKKFIFIYVVTLPLGFVTVFGYYSIPIVMLVFYILVSIELIAEEIEDPFGEDDNDLPTDTLADTIRRNVEEILP